VAVRVAQAFVDARGVVAVIGHLTSGATLAAAPVYNYAANPMAAISPSASSPAVSEVGPFTFRVCPDDGVHGSRLAEWAFERLGGGAVAVIYQNDDYGRGVRTTFTQSYTALGGVVREEDPYVESIATFEPYLRRIQHTGGVAGLLIAGTRAGAERILLTLDTVGLRPLVFGGDGLSGIEASSVPTEGTHISTAYLPDQPGARNEAFVAAYRSAYGGRLPDHRGAGAYDIVYLLARAIEEAGTDRGAIRDYVAGVGTSTPPFDGVTGSIAFDENGDVPDKEVVIGVVRGGRLVTAAAGR
jgi:branched-chain amino acid transport system substrate-binding protein